jgi:hypothetical protein
MHYYISLLSSPSPQLQLQLHLELYNALFAYLIYLNHCAVLAYVRRYIFIWHEICDKIDVPHLLLVWFAELRLIRAIISSMNPSGVIYNMSYGYSTWVYLCVVLTFTSYTAIRYILYEMKQPYYLYIKLIRHHPAEIHGEVVYQMLL